MSNFRKFISISAMAVLGVTNLLTPLSYANAADYADYDAMPDTVSAKSFSFIMPNHNVFLYAVTEANHYFVRYNGNDHTSGTMPNSEFIYDKEGELSGNAYSKIGYTFSGWNTNPNGNGTSYANKAKVWNWTDEHNDTVDIYAQWRENHYNITYDLNDDAGTSSGVHSKTPTSGAYTETLTIQNPSRTGYGFSGWDITNMDSNSHIVGGQASNATGATGVKGTQFKSLNATDNATVHFAARWSKNTNTKYTVEHFLENIGGGYPATAELTEDKTGTTDTDVTPPVQTYEGFTSPSLQTKNINADESTKFRYEYTRNPYNLKLIAGRGVASVAGSGTVTARESFTTSGTISFKYDEPVKLSFILKEGYATGVWTGYLDGASQFNMPASYQEKTASATPIVYTITYVYSGGTPQTNPTKYTIESGAITLNQPSRLHSKFEGWIGSNGDIAQKNVTIPAGSKGDRGYKATWSCLSGYHDNSLKDKCIPRNDTNYTVKHWQQNLENNEYTEVYADREVLQGTTESGTNAVAKNYPGFVAKPFDQEIITGDGSTEVHIRYDRLTYNSTITDVTGITNPLADGQYSDEPNYKYNDKVTLSADTQAGYTFAYWEVKDASNNPVIVTNSGDIDGATFNMPASSVTITPHVTTNEYHLTIISHGGLSGSTDRTYTVEDTVTLINPNRPHSDFAGWSGTDLAKPTMNVSFSGRSKDSTYEETWKCHTGYHANGANECVANEYYGSVEFNDGESHGAAERIDFTYDQYSTLPNPQQSGYDFAGWDIIGMSGNVEHYIGTLPVTGSTYNGTYATGYKNLSTEQGSTDIIFRARWTARNDTEYVIYHYYKELGKTTYELSGTDNLTGTTDTSVTFTQKLKNKEGFTYSAGYLNVSNPTTRPTNGAVTTGNIEKDGSTKIYLYYTRNTHTVNLSGDVHVNTLSGAGTYEYGADVTVDMTAKTGYHFVRWEKKTGFGNS